MANDLATRGNTALATGGNPWAEAARGVETGTYLKFNGNDGRWSFGQDDEDLPEGSRVIVDMETLAFGWICWVDGSVEEERLVPVLDGRPPQEHELTDYGPYEEDDGWREAASLSMILERYGDDDQDDAVGTQPSQPMFCTCPRAFTWIGSALARGALPNMRARASKSAPRGPKPRDQVLMGSSYLVECRPAPSRPACVSPLRGWVVPKRGGLNRTPRRFHGRLLEHLSRVWTERPGYVLVGQASSLVMLMNDCCAV